MYTDAVYEAQNERQAEFGEERLPAIAVVDAARERGPCREHSQEPSRRLWARRHSSAT
jgi:hypothetical protein